MSARARGLLTKTLPGSNGLLCPVENSLAFRREPHIALTALHDGHAEFFFKMTYRGGQGGLRDAADFCRAREMLFSRECHQIFKLTNEHGLAAQMVFSAKVCHLRAASGAPLRPFRRCAYRKCPTSGSPPLTGRRRFTSLSSRYNITRS